MFTSVTENLLLDHALLLILQVLLFFLINLNYYVILCKVQQKFNDSLVLQTTIRKKLVVRSPKELVQNIFNNNKELKLA